MSAIERYAPFNWGQFHAQIDGRDISFSPSADRSILYLCIKEPDADNGETCDPGWGDERRCTILDDLAGADPVYPKEYEEMLGIWYGLAIGADHMIIQAPSNRGIDLTEYGASN